MKNVPEINSLRPLCSFRTLQNSPIPMEANIPAKTAMFGGLVDAGDRLPNSPPSAVFVAADLFWWKMAQITSHYHQSFRTRVGEERQLLVFLLSGVLQVR